MLSKRVRPRPLAPALFFLLVACSAAPSGPGERVAETREPIVNGTGSPATQNFVVLVEHKVSCSITSCQLDECSGTLVAPNLVLTARHCVSNTTAKPFTCDYRGHGSSGGDIQADFPASSISIFVGTTRPSNLMAPDAVGAVLFHDDATNVCNHDVALIGLKEPITGVPIASLRLDPQPEDGALITSVGWGATTFANSTPTRQERPGVAILNVGPFMSPTGNDVPPNDFDVGESICEGDSGSPALDGTGAVIGVASSGGNNLAPNPNDLAASCLGKQTFNSYSKVAAFHDLLVQAFNAMGQAPKLVTGGALGDSCSSAAACMSAVCANPGSDGYCSQTCNPNQSAPCPSGYSCGSVDGKNICQQGGACSIGRGPARHGASWLAATGIVLVLARRRRASAARRG
jgi:hypothetical protein